MWMVAAALWIVPGTLVALTTDEPILIVVVYGVGLFLAAGWVALWTEVVPDRLRRSSSAAHRD